MKKKISLPIIVEGKYDKIKIDSIFDARVFVSGGFSIFNSAEKQALIKRIAGGGVILLLDSDGGGVQIRSFLNSILPKDKIYNLYIPNIGGKEKRKPKPSRSGMLGVEGMEREVLERVLAPFVCGNDDDSEKKRKTAREMITKVDFFCDKLTGADNSSTLRDSLAAHFGLPRGMSANALLEALNIITDKAGYRKAVDEMRASASPDSEVELSSTVKFRPIAK